LPALVQEAKARRKSPADRDELYPKAVEVVLGNQRGSATLLQRALGVGYTRGTRLLEMMEEDGLVGAFNDSKPREVLMTLAEYQARAAAMEEEMARIEEDEASAGGEDSSDALAGSVAGDDDGDGDGADGDESSQRPWDDVSRLVALHGPSLDVAHMRRMAESVGVLDLLARLLTRGGR
jgi:hypothetical protein